MFFVRPRHLHRDGSESVQHASQSVHNGTSRKGRPQARSERSSRAGNSSGPARRPFPRFRGDRPVSQVPDSSPSNPRMSSNPFDRRRPPNAEVARSVTEIVATIGPASEDRIGELIAAGVSVARINFSHGSVEDHRRRVAKIRAASRELGHPVGILADIQGPKLRLGTFPEGPRQLEQDARVRLVEAVVAPDDQTLPLDFEGPIESIQPGDRVSSWRTPPWNSWWRRSTPAPPSPAPDILGAAFFI